MFAVSFFAIAMLTHLLGRQMRASQALAERRGAEVANLAEINELIIRRMRTGVLLVDGDGRLRLANEAALVPARRTGRRRAQPGDGRAGAVAPPAPLAAATASTDDAPLRLGAGPAGSAAALRAPARRAATPTLVFLDDTSLLSRRAESMTLATLGRFSASLAHEIRNPLAAISYADAAAGGIARTSSTPTAACWRSSTSNACAPTASSRACSAWRAASAPIPSTSTWSASSGASSRTTSRCCRPSRGNAAGRRSSAAGRRRWSIRATCSRCSRCWCRTRCTTAACRASRRGSRCGVHRPRTASRRSTSSTAARASRTRSLAQLFRPFYTTSEHGTGLGLYIARELCLANEATLEYVAVPGGGSCFRLTAAGAASMPCSGRHDCTNIGSALAVEPAPAPAVR